jgi:hypothetical protein
MVSYNPSTTEVVGRGCSRGSAPRTWLISWLNSSNPSKKKRTGTEQEAQVHKNNSSTGAFSVGSLAAKGSNCRCKSLAAKALIVAADLIQTLTILTLQYKIFPHGLRSLWFSIAPNQTSKLS